MTRHLGLLLLAACISSPAYAQQKVLLDKSELRFTARQENVPMEGKFRKFTADVSFDPNQPQAAKAALDIDLNSIDMNSNEAETEVKRKPWFNAELFPHAKFTLASAKSLGGGKYEAQGKVTIKGVTRDVVAPFTLRQQGGEAIAEGNLILKRLDFKIGEGEWADTDTVSNDVQVRFRLTMTGVAAGK